MFALAEKEIGDLPEVAGDAANRADAAPIDRLRIEVEMIVAERLKSGKHRVDLGLLADEGIEGFRVVLCAAGHSGGS